jgi:spoIIIJ-associated protein
VSTDEQHLTTTAPEAGSDQPAESAPVDQDGPETVAPPADSTPVVEASDDADDADDSVDGDDRVDGADDADDADDSVDGADDGDEPSDSDEPSDGDSDEAPRGAAARLEREGEIAADFLERLLDIADLDGDLDVDVEGERASVAIVDSSEGRVPRRLVGQNGEVLEALQELTRLAVQARTGDRTRLMLDVAGHRARRREQLVARAQEAIAQVRESGEPLRLEAMNPFERKIVHDAVSAAGLSSSSDGVEPDRRIVVRPAG